MNVNKVFIGGNLVRTPDLRHTQGGTALAKFGIAVNSSYKADGERKDKTHFVDCTAWGKTASVIAEHLGIGDPIFVEGRLEYSTWEDKTTGKNRSKLDVTVERFQFVGSKRVASLGVASDDSDPQF